jgi:hypothetical protein
MGEGIALAQRPCYTSSVSNPQENYLCTRYRQP